MKIFPRINLLRELFNKDAEIAALDKDIAAAEDLADTGERLLRYDALAQQAYKLVRNDTLKKAVAGYFPTLGGLVMVLGGLATINPALVGGGLVLLYGTAAIGREAGKDSETAVEARAATCRKAWDDIVKSTEPRAFASSPVLGALMNFPDLQTKFELVAVREKLAASAPTVSLEAGTPGPAKSLSL